MRLDNTADTFSIYLTTFDINLTPYIKNIKQYGPDMPIIKEGWDIHNIKKRKHKKANTYTTY